MGMPAANAAVRTSWPGGTVMRWPPGSM